MNEKKIDANERRDAIDDVRYHAAIEVAERLKKSEVFVPRGIVMSVLNANTAYFTIVEDQRLGLVYVRGSHLTRSEIDAQRESLQRQKESGELHPAELKRSLNRLAAHERRGLVPDDEIQCWRETVSDVGARVHEAGAFRAYRCNAFEAEKFADALEKSGRTVVLFLPTFWYRNVVMPRGERFERAELVHALTRAPCPWSQESVRRGWYA